MGSSLHCLLKGRQHSIEKWLIEATRSWSYIPFFKGLVYPTNMWIPLLKINFLSTLNFWPILTTSWSWCFFQMIKIWPKFYPQIFFKKISSSLHGPFEIQVCPVHIENSHRVYFGAQTSQALERPNLWLIYQIAHRCHAWGYVYYLTWMSCGHLSTFKTKQNRCPLLLRCCGFYWKHPQLLLVHRYSLRNSGIFLWYRRALSIKWVFDNVWGISLSELSPVHPTPSRSFVGHMSEHRRKCNFPSWRGLVCYV